ncbi:MAG: fucose isomerase, partial [archaeon]|nr:fucose isomerase [archaeon]
MMRQLISIGVICFARKTFDYNAALDIFKKIQKNLEQIKEINWEFIPELIIEIEDAKKAAVELTSKKIDALICISGTFHLGHLILEVTNIIKTPLLLWGLNELPYDGGKIRLNSVCGINLDTSILYKSGLKNYHYIIGDDVDQDWIDAIRIIKSFSTAKIGIAGEHAEGFLNLYVDEEILAKETGILVDHHTIQDIFIEEIDKNDVIERLKQIKSFFNLDDINDNQAEKVAELTEKLKKFYDKNDLSALTIRCWPEFAVEYGISPCAAMSILQSEGYLIACEGDILGAASMLAHVAIGSETPF